MDAVELFVAASIKLIDHCAVYLDGYKINHQNVLLSFTQQVL